MRIGGDRAIETRSLQLGGSRGVALLAAALLVGCAFGKGERDVDRSPVVNTGAGASILYPGQTAPPVPTRAPQTGPEAPGAAPGAGSAPMPMLGGTTIDVEVHETYEEEPIWFKYVTLPFALLAAPFVAAADAMRDEPEPGPALPDTLPVAPAAPPAPAPVDYETARLNELERELEQRQAGTDPAPAPPATSGIAAELAALQRQPALPVPPRAISAHPTAPRSAPRSAPRPAPPGDPAQGIVDRDGDGRIDQWIYRENGEVLREALDENFDGRPDRTLYYDRELRQVYRVEEDSNHDGAVDSWTDYRDGVVARRRVDADGDGLADTWTFYQDGSIIRHEQDTTGDGFRNRIGFFRAGHLLREVRDDDADGRPDLTTYYDEHERPLRAEEDTNGDGRIDVVSHFEDGRLARRELRDETLEPVAPEDR